MDVETARRRAGQREEAFLGPGFLRPLRYLLLHEQFCRVRDGLRIAAAIEEADALCDHLAIYVETGENKKTWGFTETDKQPPQPDWTFTKETLKEVEGERVKYMLTRTSGGDAVKIEFTADAQPHDIAQWEQTSVQWGIVDDISGYFIQLVPNPYGVAESIRQGAKVAETFRECVEGLQKQRLPSYVPVTGPH